MDNYKQKIFLLCILLLGCVLTSIGVEFFTKADEPLQIPQPMILEQQIFPNERETSNLQERVSKNKRASNTNNELSKMEQSYEKTDNEKQKLAFPININTGPAVAKNKATVTIILFVLSSS